MRVTKESLVRSWLTGDALIPLSVAVVLCVGFLAAERSVLGEFGFPLDDAWMHLQYARSLATGDGFSFQGDGTGAGAAAPLWTAMLAPGAWATPVGVLWAKALGIALHLLGVAVLLSLASLWGLGRWASLLAVTLYLLTRWTLWSALSGMEISLFVLLCLLGVRQHVLDVQASAERSRFPWSTLWLSLATLARPEGLLLIVLCWAERLLSLSRQGEQSSIGLRSTPNRLGLHAGLALLLLTPTALYNLGTSGSALPMGLAATSDTSLGLPRLRDLWEMGLVLFPAQPWLTLLLGAGVVAALRTPERSLVPAAWPILLPIVYSVLGGGLHQVHHGRYLFPLFPFFCLLGGRALAELAAVMAERRLFGIRLRHAVAALLLITAVGSLRDGLDHYLGNVTDVTDSDVAMARWAAANLPRDAVLAVQDVGAFGYLAPQRLVDMGGIVTPEILPYLRGELRGAHPSGLEGWATFLQQRDVDFVVLFPASFRGGLRDIDAVLPGARMVHRATLENNITMAGPDLVVLATPWGRGGGNRP
ncbi:MAG: hypothetical protein AAF690_02020 [Acidobacteriota bacterium]